MTAAGPDLSPRDARDRWLDKMRASKSKSTVSTYYYRLKLFTAWAEDQGIESVQQLDGWDIESYDAYRRSKGIKLVTLNNELTTLKKWLEYLARIEVVDENLPEKVQVPEVPPEEQSDDTMLASEDALKLIEYYRSNSQEFGTREHVLLELIWHTGARQGGIRALDLRDICETDQGVRYLNFRHRPETDTPLKRQLDGQRPVVLNEDVLDVIDEYLENHRIDTDDEFGRQPLITSENGRPANSTIRDWAYMATVPCRYRDCPHDKDPAECEYLNYQSVGGCPSSRSPHQIITGAITWMRNRGIPAEVVAERTNKSVDTIEKYYDHEDPVKEMVSRRNPYFGNFDITTESDNNES